MGISHLRRRVNPWPAQSHRHSPRREAWRRAAAAEGRGASQTAFLAQARPAASPAASCAGWPAASGAGCLLPWAQAARCPKGARAEGRRSARAPITWCRERLAREEKERAPCSLAAAWRKEGGVERRTRYSPSIVCPTWIDPPSVAFVVQGCRRAARARGRGGPPRGRARGAMARRPLHLRHRRRYAGWAEAPSPTPTLRLPRAASRRAGF